MNRRQFLQATAITAAGMVVHKPVKPAVFGPSDRLNVALIGCRSMGWGDLTDILNAGKTQCLALCDIDSGILNARVSEIEKTRGNKPSAYGDYRRILDRKDIDIVVIGTPDHWHCLQFADACAAGKDIYVEKPVANSIAECDAMVNAARKSGSIVQVGQQQRSGQLWKDMVDYINSGKLGKIGRVHVWANFNYAAINAHVPDSPPPEGVDFDTWLGPAPTVPFNSQRFHGLWRMFWDYGGGLVTDWGVHLLDMALWGMNISTMPLSVHAVGGNFHFPDGMHQTFDTLSVHYRFPDFVLEWENNAGSESGPYGRNYGLLFHGVNGVLVANRDSWQVYPEREKIPEIIVHTDNKDRKTHVANFLDAVRTRNRNTACTIENGSLCAKYAHLANISARSGLVLKYDDKTHKFDNSKANKYLRPKYRKPWNFPE
jgi:predicted dehydrogenase